MVEEIGNGTVWTGWRAARDTLRDWREANIRKSDVVVELGRNLLENYSSKLGSEAWTVHEQVCIAALDCGDLGLAQRSLQALKKQFPGSVRARRLEGMCLEAQGDYDEAIQLYDGLLEETPTNNAVWKRKVAVYRARGETTEAIKELTQLLDVFMSDSEAWMELADLYIGQSEYDKAAFCLEELILANPHNHLYQQRYAEICYTQNTVESLETARKHFAAALKLNPDNTRALYGFCLAAHSLAIHPKAKRDEKTRNARYADWTKAQLMQKYQVDNEKLRLVEKMLDTLHVGSR